jgi:hypothetical protein
MSFWKITNFKISNSPKEKQISVNGKTAEIRNGIVEGKTVTWKWVLFRPFLDLYIHLPTIGGINSNRNDL